MISTDRKIFESESNVRSRIISYGELVDELHIVVFANKKSNFDKEYISDNTIVYPTNSFNRWFYIRGAIRLGKKVLEKYPKDEWIISTQDPFESGLVGRKLSKKFKKPLQVQIHTDFLSTHFKEESFLNKMRVRIAKKVLNSATCIRVVSKRIKQSIEIKYKLAVTPVILPIFTDITMIRDKESRFDLRAMYPRFSFIVLMNSRLESEKNVEMAIKAFAKVLKKRPKAGLVIVGDGSRKNDLIDLARSLGIMNSVVFEGWQNDVISYYKTADLFLNTSNYEGYAMTLIEAAEARCPIVTTNVGVVGDVLNESNVFVCSVGDEKCIENKIVSAVNNEDMLKNLADKAFIDTQTTLLKSKAVYLEKYKESFNVCLKK